MDIIASLELDFTENESDQLEAFLEKMNMNAGEIQSQVLRQILSKNASTEYLNKYCSFEEDGDNDKMQQVFTFKEKVPVVEYIDILPFVERVANGDSHHNILTADPIVELIRSSGTSSGKHKWFPRTAQELSHNAFFQKLTQKILNKHIIGGKRMFFRFMSFETATPGGLMVRSAASSLIRNNQSSLSSIHPPPTSPHQVMLCEDVKQSMYSQLLCGLVQREEVVIVGTVFGSGLFRVIKFLEEHWEELCSNVRKGHISDWINDPKCRQAVCSILWEPMPNLADSIEKECRNNKSWEGIIKNLWPKTKCVEVVVTGSMAQYIPKLEFYCGGLPLVSMFYVASEGRFGINLKPFSDDVSYSLIPWMAYYEFLPLLSDNHQDLQNLNKEQCNNININVNGGGHGVNVVDLTNVKIGQHYELVVTTFSGLYRYRMGDVVMVTGFEKNAPKFKFVRRQNVALSIFSEKTTEEDLSKAVSKATQNILEPLGLLITDYTSCVDLASFPGHYVLFWELQTTNNGETLINNIDDQSIMEQCCNAVDESLDATYWEYRSSNSIGPLEIRVVKEGTFDALMDFSVSQLGTSFSQYKTPKCIPSENSIHLLNSRLVHAYFSTL